MNFKKFPHFRPLSSLKTMGVEKDTGRSLLNVILTGKTQGPEAPKAPPPPPASPQMEISEPRGKEMSRTLIGSSPSNELTYGTSTLNCDFLRNEEENVCSPFFPIAPFYCRLIVQRFFLLYKSY